METVVSVLQDKLKWNRKVTCLVVFAGSVILGLISIFGYGMWADFKLLGMQMLDFFDFITNSALMPFTAFFTAILVGYVVKPKMVADEVEISGKFRFKKLFVVMIKYVAPVFLLIILASSVLSAFGLLTI